MDPRFRGDDDSFSGNTVLDFQRGLLLGSRHYSITALLIAILLVITTTGCTSLFGDDKPKSTVSAGERIPVIVERERALEADASLSDFSAAIPEASDGSDWLQDGGSPTHAALNPHLSAVPEQSRSMNIGKGSSGGRKLLARPIVAGESVFTMDALGRVSAFNVANGDRLWRVDTTPDDRSETAIGGGIGLDDNDILYATTGFGEVVAMQADDGQILWRHMTGKPLRAAPIIADDRVYVINIDNELFALSAKDGTVLWQHRGITESATLMGAAAPAVVDDNVVVAYSSGELFNLRVQNGRVAWAEVLAVPTQSGALPAIADIRGLPVISDGKVFAVSHSGRMVAVDLLTGKRAWEVDIGGVNTPVVAGNAVFVITNRNELVALVRDSGRIAWVKELQRRKDPSNSKSVPIFWNGPVLAGGRLWLISSNGRMMAVHPDNGGPLYDRETGERFFIPPIAANNYMFLVTDDGKLMVFK